MRKAKLKTAEPTKPLTQFAIVATKAMIQASKVAEKENACFGLPLIVSNPKHKLRKTNR